MASFEAGLVPHVRLELIREDPFLTYQVSRTRAKNHETNALRATPTPSQTTYALGVTGTSPGPDRQLITSMANIEKAIASKLAVVRGRDRSVTFEKRHIRASSTWPVRQAGQVAEWRRGKK